MTGRFQRMWGDFGGIKPQAALEYDCFRAQALGGANSIGDQLPPRGVPDAGAYDLIGAVYTQCEAAEPFYAGSVPLPQIGIVAPGAAELASDLTDESLEGAVQMCEEAHYDAAVLDDASSFEGLDLVILPDSVILTPMLRKKLARHAAGGGKILFSHRSGFDAEGRCLLPGTKLRRIGAVELYPAYWRTEKAFEPGLSRSDRVFYLPGDEVEGSGFRVLTQRVLPYFRRTDLAFCSHAQTPPCAQADRHPAVIEGKNFIYFAEPIFREYRRFGNTAARDGWKAAMRRLIGPAPFGDGLPTTILSVPRRRGADLILTLLHYVPTRKSLEISTIEEPGSFGGEILRMPAKAKEVRLHGGKPLPREAAGGFLLPTVKGRLLLEVPNFFRKGGKRG